jgi:hypothetical protein
MTDVSSAANGEFLSCDGRRQIEENQPQDIWIETKKMT